MESHTMKRGATNLLVCLAMLNGAVLSDAGCHKPALVFSCEDTVLKEETSPNRRYTVTVFERDCGATTDYSTIVSVRTFKERFDADKGRIFIVNGREPIVVAWQSETSLTIRCPSCSPEQIFKREKMWKGVTISY
jgi:hypothetical protein